MGEEIGHRGMDNFLTRITPMLLRPHFFKLQMIELDFLQKS